MAIKSIGAYMDCPVYLREFLLYMLTIRGRSAKTVDAYYTDIRCFLRYVKSVKMLPKFPEDFSAVDIGDIPLNIVCEISLGDMYQFLSYAQDDRQNSAVTRSRKTSAVRSFFKYLNTKTRYLPVNPLKDLEVPSIKKAMPKYLTLEESKRLLDSVDGKYRERDYCILTLLLNCGMRLSELVGIGLADIREDTLRLLGKGNKERIIYLNDACLAAIAEYLKVRVHPVLDSEKHILFLSSQARRISGRRVQQLVEGYLTVAGLGGLGYSPHKLRHTAATLMYQHGDVDIRVLKDVLGHVNLGTTEIYTHLSSKQLSNAAKASPLADVKRKARPDKKEKSEV